MEGKGLGGKGDGFRGKMNGGVVGDDLGGEMEGLGENGGEPREDKRL